MTQHTPGPWTINDWPQANSDISIGAVGTPLTARVPLRDVSINQQKANARLIAAAPELLEACKALVDSFKERPALITMGERLALDNGIAAIAKATGSS